MRNLLLTALGALISINAAASQWEWSLGGGFGLSDKAVADTAVYNYDDGSQEMLHAGTGFFFLLGGDLIDTGLVALNLQTGYHIGFKSHSEPGYERFDRFSYVPVYVTAKIPLSDRFYLSGGASYLLLPAYKVDFNGDWLKLNMESKLGYTVEGRFYSHEGTAAFTIRYSSNNLTYIDGEDSDGVEYDASNVRAENVDAITVGLLFSF